MAGKFTNRNGFSFQLRSQGEYMTWNNKIWSILSLFLVDGALMIMFNGEWMRRMVIDLQGNPLRNDVWINDSWHPFQLTCSFTALVPFYFHPYMANHWDSCDLSLQALKSVRAHTDFLRGPCWDFPFHFELLHYNEYMKMKHFHCPRLLNKILYAPSCVTFFGNGLIHLE